MFLTICIVAVVTYCAIGTNMFKSDETVFDTMIVASTDTEWL